MRWLVTLLTALVWMRIGAQALTESEVCDWMNRAFVFSREGRMEEAIEAFLIVGKNTENQCTEAERQVYVCSQLMACLCYESVNEYESGYLLAGKLLKGNITADEKKDIARLFVLNGYGYACGFLHQNSSKDLQKARSLLEEIAPYADEAMEKIVKGKIPYTWYLQGADALIRQKYDIAIPCMEKAAEGYRQLGDMENAINAIFHLATIYSNLADLRKALSEYQKAKQLACGYGDHERLLSVLIEEKRLNDKLGNTEESNRLIVMMDSLVRTNTSPIIRFKYHIYRGDEAKKYGEFELAELWYRKNDSYMTQNMIPLSGDCYVYYIRLRDLYIQMKRYDEALRFARKCVEEYQALTDSSDVNYYLPYMAIAQIYQRMGDMENCKAVLDTLFMGEKRLIEPREKQQLYLTRAMCYTTFKEYDKALADYRTLDTLLAARYPDSDADRIRILPLMGGIEHQLGHYDKSEQLYDLYAERLKDKYGADWDEYIDALVYLANAEGFAGHIENACLHYAEAVELVKEKLRKRLPYLTGQEREGYWKKITALLTNMAPFAIRAGQVQTDFTASCHDALILSKAFLLESERSVYDIVKKSSDDVALDDYATISLLQFKLRELEKNVRLNADSITAVTERIDRLSRNLSDRCRFIGDITGFMEVDYRTVHAALGKSSVLIDFTDYVSESWGRKYAAFIVNSQQENPLLLPLFAESSIDSLCILSPDYYYEEPYATGIRRLLWEPLSAFVSPGDTVYYVPSQLLFQVALESVPMADGTLLGQHYHFVRLSSARELMRYKPTLDMTCTEPSAVLYGGLDYDMELQDTRSYEVPRLFALRGDMLRGDSVFRKLPGTRKEVMAVGDILKKRGVAVDLRMGLDGTAESFVSMNGLAPQVLLVATHGFYYTPKEAEQYEYLKGYRDAMSLSGLVFSGGNTSWLGKSVPKGVMGGILTAADIAELDFTGMEMVVLSACQTGQGRATPEGLYGLQRAFKKAGAGTVVMTLWNVDDDVTRDFVVKFYESLAEPENNWNKRNAFECAKAYIRRQHPESFYWAGFVMLD